MCDEEMVWMFGKSQNTGVTGIQSLHYRYIEFADAENAVQRETTISYFSGIRYYCSGQPAFFDTPTRRRCQLSVKGLLILM